MPTYWKLCRFGEFLWNIGHHFYVLEGRFSSYRMEGEIVDILFTNRKKSINKYLDQG